MNQNLREYIQQNDKEQKKCLGMYKLAVKIRRFGLTGFYITDPEPSIFIDDDETADGWKKIKFLFLTGFHCRILCNRKLHSGINRLYRNTRSLCCCWPVFT